MDQSELVAQFCSFTAADPATAEQYLSISDNNLENAVTLFLESGGASLDSQVRASEQTRSGENQGTRNEGTDFEDDEAFSRRLQSEEYSNNNNSNPEEEVRERIRPVTETLVESGFGGMSNIPSAYSFLGQRNMPAQPQAHLNVFEEEEDELDDNNDLDEDEEMRTADEAAVEYERPARQTSALASIYRPPYDIIQNYDFDTAKEVAMSNKKWLLVNIQKIDEFACMVLNRDLWSHEDIKKVISENFIFVQYNHDSNDGQEYKQYYPFAGYPHVSILDPRTGEQLKTWTNIPGADIFVEDLIDFLNDFSFDPNHKNPQPKLPKQNKSKDVSLMSEEDQIKYAMKVSLGQQHDSDDDNIFDEEASDFEEYVPSDEEIDDNDEDEIEFLGASESSKSKSSNTSSNYNYSELNNFSALADTNTTDATTTNPQTPPSLQPADEEEDSELTPEEIFATIPPQDIPQPPPGDKDSTRIQFRLANGSRIVRRFKLSNTVRDIFSVVKEVVEGARFEYFSLTSERKKLIDMLDQTIEESGLKNSSILVEILQG